MTTYDAEPVPIGSDPRISHRDSPSPPRNLSQTLPATSPDYGTTRSSLMAVHDYYDRVKLAATVKRYERSAKLEPLFIDAIVPVVLMRTGQFSTSFPYARAIKAPR